MTDQEKWKIGLIWFCLAFFLLPGIITLLWIKINFRFGTEGFRAFISGDNLLILIGELLPTVSKDLGTLKLPDAVPFLVSACLVGLIPQRRGIAFKAVAVVICIFGYLIYAFLSSSLHGGQYGKLEELLHGELFFNVDDADERKTLLNGALGSVLDFVDGLRLVYLVVGGAFLGLKVEKKDSQK